MFTSAYLLDLLDCNAFLEAELLVNRSHSQLLFFHYFGSLMEPFLPTVSIRTQLLEMPGSILQPLVHLLILSLDCVHTFDNAGTNIFGSPFVLGIFCL